MSIELLRGDQVAHLDRLKKVVSNKEATRVRVKEALICEGFTPRGCPWWRTTLTGYHKACKSLMTARETYERELALTTTEFAFQKKGKLDHEFFMAKDRKQGHDKKIILAFGEAGQKPNQKQSLALAQYNANRRGPSVNTQTLTCEGRVWSDGTTEFTFQKKGNRLMVALVKA